MKTIKKILCICITAVLLCSCSGLNKSSTFSIRFIDVGQGDSAIVECDGHHMLIDGGDQSAGAVVYNALESEGIQRLDILAISHLHMDHFGGLEKALKYASKIDLTICNSDNLEGNNFNGLRNALGNCETEIKVPSVGQKYSLGSARVEVINVSNNSNNDSLILLITYGDTKFLFTGDIGTNVQRQIVSAYRNEFDGGKGISLMKLPHHGAYEEDNALYPFIRTFMPEVIVISVGKGNKYGHPDKRTLDLLDNYKKSREDDKAYKPASIYRTDENGDIIVKSNGKSISVEVSK